MKARGTDGPWPIRRIGPPDVNLPVYDFISMIDYMESGLHKTGYAGSC